jgi:hypothetical protein
MIRKAAGTRLLTPGSRQRQISELLSGNGGSVSYAWLAKLQRRSYRTGSWTRLGSLKRGLYRCALWVAKARGNISNIRLRGQILRIALELLQNFQSRIASAGENRAMIMFQSYAKPGGVFSWAPRVKEWLHDPGYVWYLGVMEVNA